MGTLDDMRRGMPTGKQTFGTLMEAVGAHEEVERIALGRTIVEEYKKLLERRNKEAAGKDGAQIRAPEHDEAEIRWINEQFLPQIEAGTFNLVVQPGGMIAVEASDRRIALNAPNSNWDEEFETSVRSRTTGNSFAQKVFTQKQKNSEQR